MKASLLNKLDILQDRFEELTALLGDGEVISDQTKFRAYSKEYAEVEPIVAGYGAWLKVQADLEGAQALLKDNDPDMREMAVEEVREAKERLIDLEKDLQRMLANGSNPEEVLVQLARGLTNKLLHAPSVQLKKLSAEGRLDALAMAQELFALGEGSSHSSADKK